MTPNTTVTLYATPFDITNKYVIKADSEQEALAIVSAYPSTSFTNCYWQRTDDFVFRCNGNINDIEQYNYCVFLNNGKYNFAFITKCQYVNDAMTWVYLTIDPWLNFAGQYVFHDSPMIRCHPPSNVLYGEAGINYEEEPITVTHWGRFTTVFGEPPENQSFGFLLMTKYSPLTYTQMNNNNYWDAVYKMLNNGGSADYDAIMNSIASNGTVIDNLYEQAPTTVCDNTLANTWINEILKAGKSEDILGAYYVPDIFLNVYAGTASNLDSYEDDIDIELAYLSPSIYWIKGLYHPQFKRFIVNVVGNEFEYDITKFDISALVDPSNKLKLTIKADVSYNGCISVFFKNQPFYMYGGTDIVKSNKWDRIQLMGYAVNQDAAAYNRIGLQRAMVQGVTQAVSSALRLDIVGGIADAFETGSRMEENQLQKREIVKSSGYINEPGEYNMAQYNRTFPLVISTLLTPIQSECDRINTYFGTYGYTVNGRSVPIRFDTGLPYWYYYHTMDASITGNTVPQKYLNMVIQMFNRGVFVFNDTTNYKDFSKAKQNHY